MGLYDTINGHQVKCFPWVSIYMNELSYHGGDLRCYDTGDEVPYKEPHYNYGKNFIILDLNRFLESDYCPYDYILHVIVDGKVKASFKDKIGNIDWTINENVIGYRGELLNIKSSADLVLYIKEQRTYWQEHEKAHNKWNKLFKEQMNHFHAMNRATQAQDLKKREYHAEKFDEIHELVEEEAKRIEPELESLSKKYEKWYNRDYDDLINFGGYVSAYYTELKADRKDNVTFCNDITFNLLKTDNTLYDRYLEWQEIDKDELEIIKGLELKK